MELLMKIIRPLILRLPNIGLNNQPTSSQYLLHTCVTLRKESGSKGNRRLRIPLNSLVTDR
jgi:hypothetical protein